MLHEVLWWANTRFPTARSAERESLVVETLSTLLERGLIQLFEVNSREPLSLESARQAVAADGWRTNPPTLVLELATTSLGKEACDAVPKQVWEQLWNAPPGQITRVPAGPDDRKAT